MSKLERGRWRKRAARFLHKKSYLTLMQRCPCISRRAHFVLGLKVPEGCTSTQHLAATKEKEGKDGKGKEEKDGKEGKGMGRLLNTIMARGYTEDACDMTVA